MRRRRRKREPPGRISDRVRRPNQSTDRWTGKPVRSRRGPATVTERSPPHARGSHWPTGREGARGSSEARRPPSDPSISTPSRKGVRMSHLNVVHSRCRLHLLCSAPSPATPPLPVPKRRGRPSRSRSPPAASTPTARGTGEYTPVSISGDGRYVAFESAAITSCAQGPAGTNQGFVKDLETGALTLVTRATAPPASRRANRASPTEALHGRALRALQLGGDQPRPRRCQVTNLANGMLYRRDLRTGETILVDRCQRCRRRHLQPRRPGAGRSPPTDIVPSPPAAANLEDPAGDHAETANATQLRPRDGGGRRRSRSAGASGADGRPRRRIQRSDLGLARRPLCRLRLARDQPDGGCQRRTAGLPARPRERRPRPWSARTRSASPAIATPASRRWSAPAAAKSSSAHSPSTCSSPRRGRSAANRSTSPTTARARRG